jgi:hypothetical protein
MALDLNTLKAARTVDARGTACPGPLLEAKRPMAQVPVNGILELSGQLTSRLLGPGVTIVPSGSSAWQ